MSIRGTKRNTPDIDPAEALRRHKLLDEAIIRFEGNLDELESALGMYMLGRHFGWKVLYILHSKRTVRKYEEILGISIRDEFEAEGPDADRSSGFRALKTVTNFWKAISGETPLPDKKLVQKG
jgi:hypothetical protein